MLLPGVKLYIKQRVVVTNSNLKVSNRIFYINTNAGVVGAKTDSRGDHVLRERAHDDHQVRVSPATTRSDRGYPLVNSASPLIFGPRVV